MATNRMKSPLNKLQQLSAFYTGGSIAVVPDEQAIVCACGEDVKVVDISSGAVNTSLPGDSEPITSLCVHPNGKSVVTSSRSLMSKLWDLKTCGLMNQWLEHTQFPCWSLQQPAIPLTRLHRIAAMQAHNVPVADVAFDASGGCIATGSAAREVKIWDADAGYCTHSLLGHAGIVMRVLFHPQLSLLATAGDDGVVNIWDLTTKRVAFKLTGHVSAVTAIAWSPDGQHILSAGRDKVAVLWDVKAGTKVRSIAILESVEALVVLPHDISNAVFHSGSSSGSSSDPSVNFATGGEGGAVKVWNAQTGRCLLSSGTEVAGIAIHAVVNLIALSGSKQLLSATADCTLTFMSFCEASLKSEHRLLGNLGEVTSATFLEDPTDSRRNGDVSRMRKDAPQEAALPGCVAVATNNSSFYLLSSKAFSCTRVFEGHRDIVLCIAAHCFQSAAARTWLVASGSKDNTVRVWHVPTGRCLAIGSGHLGSVSSVAFFSKQGTHLLSGGADKLIQTWNLSSLLEVLGEGDLQVDPVQLSVSAAVAAHEKEVNCVAVSPLNMLAASGGADRKARLWRLPALSMPVVLSGHKRGVWDVQFAPVDQAVLTASGDATLRLWSVKDGSCIRTFVGHGASVLRARFSGVGSKIFSSGSDGLIKVWNAQTGHCLFTEEGHEGKVWAMDSGGEHDGFAVSGADDGSLVLWGDASQAEADTVRQQHEKDVQEQQVLENALLSKQYVEAAKLAIQLQKPAKLLHVVREGMADRSDSRHALDLKLIVRDLENDQLRRLITYLRDWNTSPKHFCCAHAMLQAVFASRRPQDLMALHGLHDVIEGILLYSKRHYDRMDRLLQSTYLLDYVQIRLQIYNGLESD